VKNCLIKFILLFYFLALPTANASEMKRSILALWDSSLVGNDYSLSDIHRKLEFVFNYYGFTVDYHDINRPLPSDSEMSSRAGIVSWFGRDGMKNPDAYAVWLSKQIRKNIKVIILGEAGFSMDEKKQNISIERVNSVMSLLGLQFSEQFFDNPLLSSISKSKGAEYVEFERSLENEIAAFRKVESRSPANDVWLSVISKGDKVPSDLIVVNKRGAYVQDGFVLFNHPQDNLSSWRVNPFRLVETLFASNLYPIPDTTTLNGKRIFFSQIDGDGFLNVSNVDRNLTSGEVIYKEILQKYQLPITASVITIEMDPSKGVVKNDKSAQIARRIFALPHVAIGSHTFSHPLSWSQNPSAAELENYINTKNTKKKHTGPILSYDIPGLVLDYKSETVGSLEFINSHLAPKNKKGEILLWSGSCLPPAEAIKDLDEKNFLNINGGDSRMDELYNSHSSLSPLSRRPGNFIQVYAGNANENTYTNLWSPPFSGYKDVIQTFERTESPHRMKPVDIYYHFYSGEHEASLKSLRLAYDWVLRHDLIALYAADYVRIVKGFLSTKIDILGARRFFIRNHGQEKTFRFKTTSLFPDYNKSQNIIGHQVFQDELYVYLGNEESSLVELTEMAPENPYLISSNGKLKSKVKENGIIIYSFEGNTAQKASFFENGKTKDYLSTTTSLEVRIKE
jgi:hypothetical protein